MRKKARRILPEGWAGNYREDRECRKLREGHTSLHEALHEFSEHLEFVFETWVPDEAKSHLAGVFVRLLDEIEATERALMIEHERRAHGYVGGDAGAAAAGPMDG